MAYPSLGTSRPSSRRPSVTRTAPRYFLTCGVLAHGFARLRCTSCAVERLAPFCCKGRGDHGLARPVLGVSARVLLGFQRHRARRFGIRDGRSGCATVIQRFGDGLNLNLNSHTLLFDGVFYAPGEGCPLEFRPLPPPTDDEVGGVLARIATRVEAMRMPFEDLTVSVASRATLYRIVKTVTQPDLRC